MHTFIIGNSLNTSFRVLYWNDLAEEWGTEVKDAVHFVRIEDALAAALKFTDFLLRLAIYEVDEDDLIVLDPKNPIIVQRPQTEIGDICIRHNHGQITLREAVWHPYPVGKDHYNVDGTNGYLEGKVVSGGYTNRLLWATNFTPLEVDTVHRQDYCPITRIRPGYNSSLQSIDCCTCG